MRKINIIMKQDLFDDISVDVSQLSCRMDSNHDFMLCGSVSLNDKNKKGKNDLLYLKANLCDEEGKILYIVKSYNAICFKRNSYDTFSIYCSNVSRYFDVRELHHIEIFPNVTEESDEN